jgi:Peptidase family M41/ATPase family associated with various cellular activities (AAA)
MPQITIDHKLIQKKKKTLERVKKELKKEFIGIDYIIDELINYIQIWYLMPEVLTRPIIVNLWGMTGVGKTDLVRKLVSKLEFQDRFVEVELTNSSSGAMGFYGDSVTSILSGNEVDDGKPSIVLFDEIQRFNTIDSDGRPVVNTKFTDFWELLSDGKLAKRGSKDDINEMLERFMYDSMTRKRRLQKAKENGEEVEEEDNSLGWWQAKRVKSLFGVEGDAMSLADMDSEDALKQMMESRKKKKIYEAVAYSKALIIISGNLDDAFSMASETSESDVDADIFHAYTKKITMVDVKQSLSRRFKPEQVARFGNIHLIYRSLQRKNFEALITQEIDKIIVRNRDLFGVSLKISKQINQLIYQNGVFPVQGVRPVFSSVMDILESNLAQFLYEAFMTNQMEMAIDYSFEKHEISAVFGNGKQINIPYIGRIDKIREGNIVDITANVSVHEAGHAVVYSLLFGLAPLQLKSKLASNYAGGFTFPHQIYQTKRNMINKIKVLLAGGLAEEEIFGADNATTGRQHDREQVGIMTNEFYRMYGFDATHQAFYAGDGAARMDLTVTDPAVEAMVQSLVIETREILTTYRPYLLELSVLLHNAGSLTPDAVAKIGLKHKVNVTVRPEGFMYINGYSDTLGV